MGANPGIVFVERIVIREVLLNIGHLLQRSDLLSFRLCTRAVRCQRLVR